MSIADQLDQLATRAAAITLGTDTTSDADALLTDAEPLWRQVTAQTVPDLDRIIAKLDAALAGAPRDAIDGYRRDLANARGDQVEPPRAAAGFLVLDALQRIRQHVSR